MGKDFPTFAASKIDLNRSVLSWSSHVKIAACRRSDQGNVTQHTEETGRCLHWQLRSFSHRRKNMATGNMIGPVVSVD
jgi:hypothetical protein